MSHNERAIFSTQIPTFHPWTVLLPQVDRYLEKAEFVDDFFATGRLRLSTFSALRQIEDPEKRDPAEGNVRIRETHPNATGAELLTIARPAYILCSTVAAPGQLEDNNWKTAHGFRIRNTSAFAQSVAQALPAFKSGAEGLCSYRHGWVLELESAEAYVGPAQHPLGLEGHFQEHVAKTRERVFSEIFVKEMRFSHESEYRFAWFTDSVGFKGEPIFVTCPDAVQYCERLPPRHSTSSGNNTEGSKS